MMPDQMDTDQQPDPFETLSPREAEVARLIAEDLSDKEIANILQISPKTVQAYLERIKHKLGLAEAHLSRRRAIRRIIEGRPAA